MKYVTIFMLTLVSISCVDETDDNAELYVDAQLISFFESFESEANLRGRNISLDNFRLSGYLVNLDNDVVGQCATLSNGEGQVRVDQIYWNRASPLERELLIFHELGHCILGRSHDDTSNRDGVCQSMMNSGLGDCNARYNSATREDYLDELFLN